MVHEGGVPIKYTPETHHIEKSSKPKMSQVFHDQEYVLERAIRGDFAIVKAYKADPEGNLIFRYFLKENDCKINCRSNEKFDTFDRFQLTIFNCIGRSVIQSFKSVCKTYLCQKEC